MHWKENVHFGCRAFTGCCQALGCCLYTVYLVLSLNDQLSLFPIFSYLIFTFDYSALAPEGLLRSGNSVGAPLRRMVRVNEKIVSEMKLLETIDELDSHFKTSHGVVYQL